MKDQAEIHYQPDLAKEALSGTSIVVQYMQVSQREQIYFHLLGCFFLGRSAFSLVFGKESCSTWRDNGRSDSIFF